MKAVRQKGGKKERDGAKRSDGGSNKVGEAKGER